MPEILDFIYKQNRASPAGDHSRSLSSFYINTIDPCPKMVMHPIDYFWGLVPCDFLRIQWQHSMLFFQASNSQLKGTHRGNNSVQI